MTSDSEWIVRLQNLVDLVAVSLMIRWTNPEGEMRHAVYATMVFVDEIEKDEVVIALELFAESSGSIHSARAPAPAPLLQGKGVRVREVVRKQQKECRGVLLLLCLSHVSLIHQSMFASVR